MNRALQSSLAGLGAVALFAASGAARADVSSTITIASDYDFRGITQSALDPVLQVSLDWEGESGLYAGLWGSNIDFGEDGAEGVAPVDLNIELDFILGYAGSITEDFGYDVGATYYKYLGDDDNGLNDFDYYELYAGLGYRFLSAKVWYAPDFSNAGESAWYAEANAEVPLPADFTLLLHAGYNAGDYWKSDDIGLDEFADYSVGLGRSFGRFDFQVKYIDGSDLDVADGTPNDVFTSEGKFWFAVSTTFPWADEEAED
jgi:uncharacterized protein (TIGR02001 family)